MATRTPPSPFHVRDGRLWLEDVDLVGLSGELDGRAAWLISHAAIAAALQAAGQGGPRRIDVSTIGPPAVLGLVAAEGWWARIRSSHELTLALEAGFPPERLVAADGVRDDGFVKDALAAGVAVMEHADLAERANAARIAALLDHELPPAGGAPPDAPADLLARCGGLLAPVLRPPPALAIDAVCPRPADELQVLALHAAESAAPGAMPASVGGTLAGLDASERAQAALVPPHVQRGDWVVLPAAASAVRPVDPAHPAACTVLVRGESWRLLAARPLPPELD